MDDCRHEEYSWDNTLEMEAHRPCREIRLKFLEYCQGEINCALHVLESRLPCKQTMETSGVLFAMETRKIGW